MLTESQSRITIDLTGSDSEDSMDVISKKNNDDDEVDALDFLTATSSTAVSPGPDTLRRSKRTLVPILNLAPKPHKRRRSLSPVTVQKKAGRANQKKQKVDDRKAVSAAV
jgi:hypothetical protein